MRCATTAAPCCGSPTSAPWSITRRLARADHPDRITHLVIDLDPPERRRRSPWRSGWPTWSATLWPSVGLEGAVKTSGAKGVHVFVPIDDQASPQDAAAATRAIAARAERLDPEIATTAFMKEDRGGKVFVDSTRVGGATVVAAYSPRARPGVPVSFPVQLGHTSTTSPRPTSPCIRRLRLLGDGDPWAAQMPSPQPLSARAHRGRPRHPGRSGAGHARGQAPSPGPPYLMVHLPRPWQPDRSRGATEICPNLGGQPGPPGCLRLALGRGRTTGWISPPCLPWRPGQLGSTANDT